MARFRKLAAAVAATVLLSALGVIVDQNPASATKVANPGSAFTLRFASGTLNIGDNGFDFVDEGRLPQCSDGTNNDGTGADGRTPTSTSRPTPSAPSATDDSETQPGFQAKLPIQLNNGTINANGAFTFPRPACQLPAAVPVRGRRRRLRRRRRRLHRHHPDLRDRQLHRHHQPDHRRDDLRHARAVERHRRPARARTAASTRSTSTARPPAPPPARAQHADHRHPVQPGRRSRDAGATTALVPGRQRCGTVAFFVNLNDEINEPARPPLAGRATTTATFTRRVHADRPAPGVTASFTATPTSAARRPCS